MSLWHTLHLLHYPTFETEVVGALREGGPKLLASFEEYFRSYEGRLLAGKTEKEVQDLMESAVAEIHSLSLGFDGAFQKHDPFNTLTDWNAQRAYMDSLEWGYEFSKFFEWLVFRHAADFFPHIPMGKRSLFHHLEVQGDSFAEALLAQFSDTDQLHCAEGRGIIQWLTPEETAVLHSAIESLQAEDAAFMAAFAAFLQIVVEHGLGLIQGLEMAEHHLELLPQEKILPAETWNGMDSPYLLFER